MTTLNISTQVAPSHRRTTGQQSNPLPTNKSPNNQRPWPGFADSLFFAAAKGAFVALQVVCPDFGSRVAGYNAAARLQLVGPNVTSRLRKGQSLLCKL